MLSIRLDTQTEERIDKLSKATHRPKSFFVKEALANYLDDLEDYYEAPIQVISATPMLFSLLLKSYHRKLHMVS